MRNRASEEGLVFKAETSLEGGGKIPMGPGSGGNANAECRKKGPTVSNGQAGWQKEGRGLNKSPEQLRQAHCKNDKGRVHPERTGARPSSKNSD